MRTFLVCKKERGNRRELVGLYLARDKAELRSAVSPHIAPERCLFLEATTTWGINLIGRINQNSKKAFFKGMFLSQEVLEEASVTAAWREFSEIE